MHKKAPAAHAASAAAQQQGKFWEMHDIIFANQREISPEKYVEWAQQLGLDMDKFRADYASAEIKSRVDTDAQEAKTLGVTGTPAFFVNGRFLSGAKPFEDFAKIIDEELKKGG
jgi:protein-disulfide isomerase